MAGYVKSYRARGPRLIRFGAWRTPKTIFSPDRKSTRLNSSHANISYAVFCLKKNNHSFATLFHFSLSSFHCAHLLLAYPFLRSKVFLSPALFLLLLFYPLSFLFFVHSFLFSV